jgi:hypothetical protein
MNQAPSCLRAIALATMFLMGTGSALAAATPPPHPVPSYPQIKLHTEFVVEVNDKGQVVRVKSGKSSSNLMFNAQTYGNVLQMWIRHPDGSAEVGLYRVTYDYDPNGHQVKRSVALVQPGGTWGNEEGAANEMMDIANKEARKGAPAPTATPKLPPLNQIINVPPAAPGSPHPR